MNPIIKAIREIKYRIPPQILNQVFQKKAYRFRDVPISIDEQIINQVINPRVIEDCNLLGGTEILVPLIGLEAQYVDEFTVIYKVPMDRTQNRPITSVLSMSYLNGAAASYMTANANFRPCSVSPVLQAGQAMMDAMSPMPVPSTARVQLIGENTVMIRELTGVLGTGELRCLIGYDQEMSNLQIRTIHHFCHLCTLAVKSFIHNESVIIIDQAQLHGGVTLGAYKSVVDGYADSEELYQTYLRDVWQQTLFMNDRESFERHFKWQIGGFR